MLKLSNLLFINLNCITNSWNWNTYVNLAREWVQAPWRRHDSVETYSSGIIYKLIVIVLLLVILQNNKNARYVY